MTESEELAAEFETHRPYLHAIAFRMLSSHADADDAIQEAWLRLARAGGQGIEDLRGWLTTVTGRICLDMLRRRGVRAEQPLEIRVGMLPREAAGGSRIDPEEEALLADSVGLALYVVMDALTPAASHESMPTLISSGCSARTPRLRSISRQIRPVTVVSQPRRSSMPPPPVRASRSHASRTTSSASACEPSMRNAITWR